MTRSDSEKKSQASSCSEAPGKYALASPVSYLEAKSVVPVQGVLVPAIPGSGISGRVKVLSGLPKSIMLLHADMTTARFPWFLSIAVNSISQRGV